jgi:hypothetical protein
VKQVKEMGDSRRKVNDDVSAAVWMMVSAWNVVCCSQQQAGEAEAARTSSR